VARLISVAFWLTFYCLLARSPPFRGEWLNRGLHCRKLVSAETLAGGRLPGVGTAHRPGLLIPVFTGLGVLTTTGGTRIADILNTHRVRLDLLDGRQQRPPAQPLAWTVC
jgi:hypothetical protein